jgi:hypothetical protein
MSPPKPSRPFRDVNAIVIQVDDAPTLGDRIIVSRLREPSPTGKTMVLECHYRNRDGDDLSMGRYGYRVAFFEVDDETAGCVADAIKQLLPG